MSAVAFNEVAIGAALALSQDDTILQTSSTVDGHRHARSQYGVRSTISDVEFYLYSPNGVTPTLTPTAGLPPASVGICTSQADLSKGLGEDAYGWAFCFGDGKVYHNGAVVATFTAAALSQFVTVVIDPIGGILSIAINGDVVGSIDGLATDTTYFYAGTVSGAPGDLGLWANASQSPRRYPLTPGFIHAETGITPTYLGTEPFISKPSDTLPHLKFSGDVARGSDVVQISNGVTFWPFGDSAPPQLRGGCQATIPILDPKYRHRELVETDIRDQLVSIARAVQHGSLDAAENLFSGVLDHCDPRGNQQMTLYANGKLSLLDVQPTRPLFPPDADASVALKPRPIHLGPRRTFTAPMYDTTNRYVAAADDQIGAVGTARLAGKPLALGIDYSLTPDGEGFVLTDAPSAKLTFETTDYGGSIGAASSGTDELGGDGAFGSGTAQTGTYAGQPVGWQGDGGYYGQDPKNTVFQLEGTSPNKTVDQINQAAAVYTLKHNSFMCQPGTTYAYEIDLAEVPAYGPSVDSVTGLPTTALPATLVIGGTPNTDNYANIAFWNWKRFQIPEAGVYRGIFTNSYATERPFTLGLLCNSRIAPGGGYLRINSIKLVTLPDVLTETELPGPDLDTIIKQIVIDRGPFELSDYDGTAAQAIDADTGYIYSLGVGTDETPLVSDCLRRVLESACCAPFINRAGKLSICRLRPPENETTVAGTLLTTTDLKGELVAYPDLAENLTSRLSGRQNESPYTDSDFSGVSEGDVPQPLRKLLQQPFQWTAASNAPVATRYRHALRASPLASCFDRQVHGKAEISRVCGDVYGDPRNFYVGTWFAPVGRLFDIDQVWEVIDPDTGWTRQLLLLWYGDQASEGQSLLVFHGL